MESESWCDAITKSVMSTKYETLFSCYLIHT